MNLIETVEWLSGLRGVSGDEDAVRAAIEQRLRGVCELRTDALGNLLAFKKGAATPGQRLLFSAHMDEVGFIVTHIAESGLLRFAACGGIDSRVVVGKPVEVGSRGIPGVIGVKATHHAETAEKETPLKLDDLYIDIGAETREQAEEWVQPGERVVFHAPFRRLGEDKILGRAFDDRAGCALLLHLAESELPYDCHFAFTVQEETGCTGASTAAYAVAPDIAFVVETTTASDVGGVPEDKQVCRLGQGPVLSFMDRGTVYDRALYKQTLAMAQKAGIPVQSKEGVYGGNESRAVQIARAGARVLAISMPCRYIHSPSNVLQVQDVENTFRLLQQAARSRSQSRA